MKTPDEIKKGLEYCSGVGANCDICPYQCCNVAGRSPACDTEMEADALAYIQQLEAKIPKWISVENPPKEHGEYIVLVQRPNGSMERTWDIYHPNAGWREDCGAKVLCWMSYDSLPEPPKGEV